MTTILRIVDLKIANASTIAFATQGFSKGMEGNSTIPIVHVSTKPTAQILLVIMATLYSPWVRLSKGIYHSATCSLLTHHSMAG